MVEMLGNEKLESLLRYVRQDSRVCPMPMLWHRFYNLVSKNGKFGEFQRLAPLVLGGWNFSTDDDKQERLAYQIRWAFEHQTFAAANRFLHRLQVDEWHHSDHCKPRGPSAVDREIPPDE